jgi:hypothetical protein
MVALRVIGVNLMLNQSENASRKRDGARERAPAIERRKYLVDALYEVLPALERVLLKEGSGRHLGLFLRDALIRHADDETLIHILEDVHQTIQRRGGYQG